MFHETGLSGIVIASFFSSHNIYIYIYIYIYIFCYFCFVFLFHLLCLNMWKNAPVIELVRNHWWVHRQLCEDIIQKYGLASSFFWASNHPSPCLCCWKWITIASILVSGVIPETKKLFAMSFALISMRLEGSEALKSQICRGITFPQGCVKGEVGSRKALVFLFTNKKLIKI